MGKKGYTKIDLEAKIKKLDKYFPAVVFSGPRQSGKLTTLRRLFDLTYQYSTFYDPVIRGKCQDNPKLFMKPIKY